MASPSPYGGLGAPVVAAAFAASAAGSEAAGRRGDAASGMSTPLMDIDAAVACLDSPDALQTPTETSDASSEDLPSAEQQLHAANGAAANGGLAAALMSGATDAALEAPDIRMLEARFRSQCEHHLLPFYGVLKIAYNCPAGPQQGGSGEDECADAGVRAALQHAVDMFSRRLQVQERLTHQVRASVCAPQSGRAHCMLPRVGELTACSPASTCLSHTVVHRHSPPLPLTYSHNRRKPPRVRPSHNHNHIHLIIDA
jgi:hypothetical protein